MSIKNFKPITQSLELISPKDGTPLGIFINVVGPDSKQVRDIERQLQKEGIAKGKTSSAEVELEEIEAVLIRKFAAAVVGWDAKYDADMEGAFSPEHVLELFNDNDYRWVVDQVASYVSHRHNFFR